MSRVNQKQLKQLEVGQAYSYKNLCDMGVFDKYYNSGNSKKAQLTELSTYCEYEKAGSKYKIIQVFDKPIVLIDENINMEKNEYRENVQLLVLNRLNELEAFGYHMTESPIKICEEISLVNQNFRKTKNALHENNQYELEFIAKQYGENVTPKTLDLVINNIQRMVIPILKGALEALESEGTITFETKWKCCKFIDGKKTMCYCTKEEKDLMMNTEDKVKKELGVESKSEFVKNPKLKAEFDKKCKEVYINHGILYFYKAWDIQATKSTIESGIMRISKKITAKARKELNENIVDGVNKRLEKTCDNMTEKYKPKKVLGKNKTDRPKQTGLKGESQEPDFKDKCKDIGTKVTSRKTRKKIQRFEDIPDDEE
mgnify:CR=1 FL=1